MEECRLRRQIQNRERNGGEGFREIHEGVKRGESGDAGRAKERERGEKKQDEKSEGGGDGFRAGAETCGRPQRRTCYGNEVGVRDRTMVSGSNQFTSRCHQKRLFWHRMAGGQGSNSKP